MGTIHNSILLLPFIFAGCADQAPETEQRLPASPRGTTDPTYDCSEAGQKKPQSLPRYIWTHEACLKFVNDRPFVCDEGYEPAISCADNRWFVQSKGEHCGTAPAEFYYSAICKLRGEANTCIDKKIEEINPPTGYCAGGIKCDDASVDAVLKGSNIHLEFADPYLFGLINQSDLYGLHADNHWCQAVNSLSGELPNGLVVKGFLYQVVQRLCNYNTEDEIFNRAVEVCNSYRDGKCDDSTVKDKLMSKELGYTYYDSQGKLDQDALNGFSAGNRLCKAVVNSPHLLDGNNVNVFKHIYERLGPICVRNTIDDLQRVAEEVCNPN